VKQFSPELPNWQCCWTNLGNRRAQVQKLIEVERKRGQITGADHGGGKALEKVHSPIPFTRTVSYLMKPGESARQAGARARRPFIQRTHPPRLPIPKFPDASGDGRIGTILSSMVYLIREPVTWRASVLEGPEREEGSGSVAQVAAYLIAAGPVAFPQPVGGVVPAAPLTADAERKARQVGWPRGGVRRD
jgi:hypothetical protein